MLIKKILGNKKSKLKYVVIPQSSDLKVGDFVEIIKVNSQKEEHDRDNPVK